MDNLLKIGELAKLFNLNIRTLRYYDQVGLLKPRHVDPKTGYRYYSIEQFERLDTIKYLRDLRCSIEKINHFFENKEIDQLLNLLNEQQKEVQQQKLLLDNIELKINQRIQQITDAANSVYNTIEIKQLPKRAIITLKKSLTADPAGIEPMIKELQRQHGFKNNIFLGKVGLSITKAKFMKQSFTNYSGLFIFLDLTEFHQKQEWLAAGSFLCLRLQGGHTQAATYYQKLWDYITYHQLTIIGDILEFTLIDQGVTEDSEKFVTEIQIPITST